VGSLASLSGQLTSLIVEGGDGWPAQTLRTLVAALPRLTHLDICRAYVRRDSWGCWAALGTLAYLQSLSSGATADILSEEFSRLTSLTVLEMNFYYSNGLRDGDLAHLPRSLRKLSLDRFSVELNDSNLVQRASLTSLTDLRIGCSADASADALCSVLGALTSLTVLHLWGVNSSFHGLVWVLTRFTFLQDVQLKFRGNHPWGHIVFPLLPQLRRLQRIVLSDIILDDYPVDSIVSRLRQCKQLCELTMNVSPVIQAAITTAMPYLLVK